MNWKHRLFVDPDPLGCLALALLLAGILAELPLALGAGFCLLTAACGPALALLYDELAAVAAGLGAGMALADPGATARAVAKLLG